MMNCWDAPPEVQNRLINGAAKALGAFPSTSQLSAMVVAVQERIPEMQDCPVVEMETTTVQILLEKLGNPKVIDFISLDTEGNEVDILRSFPFDSVCISVWIIEVLTWQRFAEVIGVFPGSAF
mmetsp:Transcript_32129/g.58753  ORF Transcript_32129/g.58753 Transcript_32129/m.58753 type:complete len:123 (+) Transcript_32129:447-815(+)